MSQSIKYLVPAVLVLMMTAGFYSADRPRNPGIPYSLVMATSQGDSFRGGNHVLHPKYPVHAKRDPFVPLVTETKTESEIKRAKKIQREAISRKRARKVRRFTKFGKEIKSLGRIPVELYRKIEKQKPDLYASLDHYSRLFREETGLRKLFIPDYIKTVQTYKRLINNANKLGQQMTKTPLQTELETLRLVGIIWGGAKPVALVETSSHKGHTVRQGMLVGPHFGVVESIDPDHIVVVERDRDFRGDVKSRTQKIQLIKNLKAKREKS